MQKIILTSTGFTNKNIKERFLELVNIPADKIKVIFIPTAAITEDAKGMIPICKGQLLNAGILEDNIYTIKCETIN